jgi:hypothetical protein
MKSKEEVTYWKESRKGSTKKYIQSIGNFREILWDYQPSQIYWDVFDEDVPYINGHYKDGYFSGSYTNQSGLNFNLNSMSQLENVFKEGMYIYV